MKLWHDNPINILITAAFSVIVIGAEETITNSSFTFAVIPKNTKNDFFAVVEEGCLARSSQLPNVSCLYVGPEDDKPVAQASIIDAIINGTYGRIDGISISVSHTAITGEAIDRAMIAGIPVITFDSDAPDSLRKAYIGTDNFSFGIELGKVLVQLAPTGGNANRLSSKNSR